MATNPFWHALPTSFVEREPLTTENSQQWDPLLICVAGYMLTAVGRVHQLFPALELFHPALVLGVGAIALYLFDHSETRQSRDVFVASTKYVVILLAWTALSVPGALVASHSFDLLVNNFVKTVLMYFIIAGSIRDTRDVERLAATYLASATLYAFVVITRFDLGAGQSWRLGHLYYYDANDFATFAVTALPFGLYFLHAARRSLTRALAALSLAILTLAFVYTGSRGGFLAIVAVALFIVARYTGVAVRWKLLTTALVAAVFLSTASDQYWKQMSTIFSDADYNHTEEAGRMQIWSRGVGYMLDNPVFGVGAQNFQSAEGMLSPFAHRQQLGLGVRWNAAHNTFVQVGAELGLPGLVIFVCIIGSAFRVLSRARRVGAGTPDARHTQLSQALTAALIGFVVGAFFLSLAYSEMFYALIALAVGFAKVTVGSLQEQPQ